MKNIYVALLSLFAFATIQAQENKFNLIIGTFTKKCDSKGIYVYEFDSSTGDFKLKSNTENIVNPTFLTVSKDNKFVYSFRENDKNSTVIAFAYDSKSGKLDPINYSETKGQHPCHIINDDVNVITANYDSGSISVLGRNSDGSIGAVKQVVQHTGKSVNEKRQQAAHAHMVYFSPDKKYVLANDLGNDKVYVYQYNPNSPTEILKLKNSYDMTPGSGPRHLIFSKDEKYVFLLQELNGALTSYRFTDGVLQKLSETTVLAADFKGVIGAADIHTSADGKFLYATNRGEANDITVFKILKNGGLEFIQRTPTLGNAPRNFAIDPTGEFLLIGHQNENGVVIFKRDKKTGMITPTGKRIDMCAPVCLIFTKI